MTLRVRPALLSLVLFAAPAFASRTILFYENECCRPITEGEFAILYVQGLRLPEPAQGWTVQSAAAALTAHGHQPEGGWVLSRYLSESIMAGLLKGSPFYRKPFTEEQFGSSTTLVLIARARGVFPASEGITQGEFALLLVQALKLETPKGGWSPARATEVLAKSIPPVGPVRGWRPAAVLREAEMLQILAPTRFRGSVVDPSLEIAPVHAYSIFFGSAEVATEGHFGLLVVNALNVAPPPGGWTRQKALEYIERDLGIQNGYGWNSDSPLCAEVFEDALHLIEEKTRKGPVTATSAGSPGQKSGGQGPVSPSRGAGSAHSRQSDPHSGKVSGQLVQELRASGVVPSDPCSLVPVRTLTTLWQPPPATPTILLPASRSGSRSASESIPPER